MAFNFIKRIFGKSEKSGLPKELVSAMDSLKKEIFPNGMTQVQEELKELSEILGVSESRITDTYFYACSRIYIGNCDKETLVTGIARHENGLSKKQIEAFAKFVFKKMLKQKSGLEDGVFLESTLNALGFLSDDHGGFTYDEIPGGSGDFGVTITNPVPVNGITSNERYLSRLKTADGLNISWNRLGSGGADNIENPIDIYEITDENGRRRDTIYISPYHPATSKKAPKGYVFK